MGHRIRKGWADLWRSIWECMEDIGEGAEVIKVVAHTSWWDVVWGRISARDGGGNGLADKEANRALREALRQAPTAAYNSYWERAVGWATGIAGYAAEWIVDTAQDDEREGRSRGRRSEAHRTTLGHEIWELGDLWVCRRCGRQFVQRDARRA